MKKVLIVTGPGFQDEEVIYPYYRFKENYEVDIATSTDTICYGKYGCKIKPTIIQSNLHEQEYDCIFVPGGHEGPDRVRQCIPILDAIRKAHNMNKIISTICHGPWVLISANITKNIRITGYIAIRDDLINSGAIYEEAQLVVDKNIVSSPHYDQNHLLIKKTCELLGN